MFSPLTVLLLPVSPLSQVKHLTSESVRFVTPGEFPGGLLLTGTPASKPPRSSRAGAGIMGREGRGAPGAKQPTGAEVREGGKARAAGGVGSLESEM